MTEWKYQVDILYHLPKTAYRNFEKVGLNSTESYDHFHCFCQKLIVTKGQQRLMYYTLVGTIDSRAN